MAKKIFFHSMVLISVVLILIAANKNSLYCLSLAYNMDTPEDLYYVLHYNHGYAIGKGISIAVVFNFCLYMVNCFLHLIVFKKVYNKYLFILFIIGLIIVGGFGLAGCFDPRNEPISITCY